MLACAQLPSVIGIPLNLYSAGSLLLMLIAEVLEPWVSTLSKVGGFVPFCTSSDDGVRPASGLRANGFLIGIVQVLVR